MIFYSAALGTYSTHSCKVDGTNPGMMSPMPFSIQMPTPHGTFRIVRIQHEFPAT